VVQHGRCGDTGKAVYHAARRTEHLCQRPELLTALASSLVVIERTMAMSLAKKFEASQHRATISWQVSKTGVPRRLAVRAPRSGPGPITLVA
jgi:hypothetical protein